jgi:NTE family protein
MNAIEMQAMEAVLRQSALFAELDPAFVRAQGWQPEPLAEGQILFRQGEPADGVFVVLSGVLGLFTGPWSGSTPIFRKVFRGDLVGEYALLCGEPRSASAVALTAVQVLRIPADGFEALLSHCPGLERAMLQRLALQASRGRQANRPAPTTIVVGLAPGAGAEARAVLRDLLAAVRGHWQGQGSQVLDEGAGAAALEDQLVEALESGRPSLCLLGHPTDLTLRNRKLIDRLVVIADGPGCAPLPSSFPWQETLLVRAWPGGTGQLAPGVGVALDQVAQVINVRAGDPAHTQRLLRCVLGIPTVLVLGGGGARGFAHIGVLAALEELASEPIDMVLGVSFGALVASLFAFEHPAAEVLAQLERVIIRSRPYAPVLSRRSLFSLQPSYRELKRFFGDAAMHDSWRPLHCFSTNLSRNRLHTWTHGELCTAVIASMSIPGVFRPVLDAAGEVHVDGGVLNNLPVDRARALTAGRVIAVTLDAEAQPASGVPSIPRAIVDSMMCASHANSLQVEAQANLMLRPEVCSYSFLDWQRYRQIQAAGYACAKAALQACR